MCVYIYISSTACRLIIDNGAACNSVDSNWIPVRRHSKARLKLRADWSLPSTRCHTVGHRLPHACYAVLSEVSARQIRCAPIDWLSGACAPRASAGHCTGGRTPPEARACDRAKESLRRATRNAFKSSKQMKIYFEPGRAPRPRGQYNLGVTIYTYIYTHTYTLMYIIYARIIIYMLLKYIHIYVNLCICAFIFMHTCIYVYSGSLKRISTGWKKKATRRRCR